MKKLNLIFLLFFSLTLFSCLEDDESTSGVSKVTNFPIITLFGENQVIINQGDTYTEEGAVSMEGENEIETKISYTSGVYQGFTGIDTSKPDHYTVNYAATNADGFDGSAMREVWVANTGDLTTSIEGLYLSSVQRAPAFEASAKYNDLQYVIIWKTGDNTYEISHAIGGYYSFGRGYGPNYAARYAEITANDIPGNSFTSTIATLPTWGNTVEITDFTVNATTKTITYTGTGNFGNGAFKVQLKQVQF